MFFKKSKTNIIISDTNFNIIKKNLNLKFIPKEGDFLYFGTEKNYYLVHKIIHNIDKENKIWITITPVENNEIT